jgi:hypothetical protein
MSKRESYNPRTKAITPTEYGGLQKAFDFFKEHLFKERWLPDVFITYQRKSRSYGYFGPDRFSVRDGESGKHEIALNPDGFKGRSDAEILSTLVHEMVHLWQHLFGIDGPPQRAYHDKEFAAKMKSLGLQPSTTGEPGGKEIGQHMSHYIVPGGPFEQAYQQLATSGWKLSLESVVREPVKAGKNSTKSKTKFTCPVCGLNAWAKPDATLTCTACAQPMQPSV